MERHPGLDSGRLYSTASTKFASSARLRRGDPEPRGRRRRGQRGGAESTGGERRPATGREQGKGQSPQEEEEPPKRRRRTTEAAMEELARSPAAHKSLQGEGSTNCGGATSCGESSTSLPGTGPGMAPGSAGARICSAALGTPAYKKLDTTREAEQQPAPSKSKEEDPTSCVRAWIANESSSTDTTSDSDLETGSDGTHADNSRSPDRGARRSSAQGRRPRERQDGHG